MSARVTPKENGSLRIEGDFQIVDMQGNVYDLGGRTSVSLCRCGQSRNKPFCDGSHRTAGFVAESKAFALPPVTTKG
jgi:CDGSH-type Zn-finger protein